MPTLISAFLSAEFSVGAFYIDIKAFGQKGENEKKFCYRTDNGQS